MTLTAHTAPPGADFSRLSSGAGQRWCSTPPHFTLGKTATPLRCSLGGQPAAMSWGPSAAPWTGSWALSVVACQEVRLACRPRVSLETGPSACRHCSPADRVTPTSRGTVGQGHQRGPPAFLKQVIHICVLTTEAICMQTRT